MNRDGNSKYKKMTVRQDGHLKNISLVVYHKSGGKIHGFESFQ